MQRRIIGSRILIADDDKDFAQVLALRCREAGYQVETVHNRVNALAHVVSWAPDLLCLDVNLPDGSGLSACETLARDVLCASLPIIILTGRRDPDTVRRCRELGAQYVFKSTDIWQQLEPQIRGILESGPVEPPIGAGLPAHPPEPQADEHKTEEPAEAAYRVLAIDDDPEIANILSMRLAPYGVEVISARTGMSGFDKGLRQRPDAIITDLAMPNGDGQYISERFHAHPLTRDVPIIVLSGQKDDGTRRQMLKDGAAAYLSKPLNFEDLLNELRLIIHLPEESNVAVAQLA